MEYQNLPIVADGAIFPDGRTVLAWRGKHPSTAVYDTFRDMFAIHAHESSVATECGRFEAGSGEVNGVHVLAWWQVDHWGNAIAAGNVVNGSENPGELCPPAMHIWRDGICQKCGAANAERGKAGVSA